MAKTGHALILPLVPVATAVVSALLSLDLSAAAWAEYARPHGVPVITGNADYEHRDVPDVTFAHRDADAFRRYVVEVLSYDPEHVVDPPPFRRPSPRRWRAARGTVRCAPRAPVSVPRRRRRAPSRKARVPSSRSWVSPRSRNESDSRRSASSRLMPWIRYMTSFAIRCGRGGAAREPRGVVEGLREEAVRVDHPVHEADAVRVLGIEEVSRQDHLHRVAEADDLLEAHERPVARMEAPARVLEAEAGVGCAEADVGREGELEPAGHRVAVHRRDDGLEDGEVPGDAAEAGAVREAAPELRDGGSGVGHRVGLEVRARGERPVPRPGDDRTARVVVRVELLPSAR